MFFENREEALNRMISILDRNIDEDTILLAISEQGVYYAKEIAKRFSLMDTDLLFSEILYAPNNRECSIGCISETEDYVLIEELINSFSISLDFIYSELKRLYEEKIISYIYKYRQGDSIISLKDRKVLLVDEGAVTGLTLEACIKSCISEGAKQLDVVMPVVPKSLGNQVKKLADNCYFVHEIENFVDIDFYFKDRKEKI